MMRYLRTLSDRDLALDRTMIPLGSCTMKLNSAVEMESITWPEFASIHPYVPAAQAQGWHELIDDLEAKLVAITGYAGISVQPNAGSQGEYAGLLAIRRYHDANGDAQRTICLIPASAHGTNAASAVLAGMSVVVVKTAEDGTIDAEDLDAKIEKHGAELAAIMITYPSTHGVYEGDVRQVCDKIHAAGGQVYIDGANLNALVGLAQPGEFGGDVSHLNLHKTFCIPHGGGGPGVGPIGVGEHLLPFLPGDATGQGEQSSRSGAPVTATVFGSAGVLPISWAYIALMGGEGHEGHRHRDPERQLPGAPTLRALPDPLHRCGRARRPRVHLGPAGALRAVRGDRRRRRQAPHRLRIPRPHHGVPGGRHADGRAHRVRGPGRD